MDAKRNTLEIPVEKKNSMEYVKPSGKPQSMAILRLSLDVLSSPAFIIVSVAYACYFTTSAVFLMVAVDFARDRSMTAEEGVYLVSAFSVGDLCGRLSCGWLADLQWIRRTTLVRVYLFAMGAFISLLPICSHGILSAVVVLLGILNGGVIINHSVLLNEYLGLEKLPLAMGFSTCFVGMTAFLRPIVIGFFRDHHQSYNQLFYFLGLLQISITVIWSFEVVIPTIKRCCNFVHKLTQ